MFSLAQVDDRIEVHRDWFKDYKFHLVTSVEQLSKLVDICIGRKITSLDLETTGVDNRIYKDEYFEDGIVTRYGMRTIDKVVGICISFDGVNGYYIPVLHEPEDSGNLPWDETWDEIERLCKNCRIIFHNAKFDTEFLYPLVGIEMWDITQYEDTFLIAKVISPNKAVMPAGLKPLAKKYYGVDMLELDDLFTEENKEFLKKTKQGYNFSLLHPREGVEYGCSDGIFTLKLYFTLVEKLQEYDHHIYKLEKSFCNVIRKMERNRVHIDVERVNQLLVECKDAMREVGDKIRSIIEERTGQTGKWRTLNIGSPKQLSIALITDPEGLKLKPTSEMIGDGESGFSTNYDDSPSDDDDDDDGGEKQFSLKDEVLKSLNRAYGEKLSAKVHDKDVSLFDLILEYRHYDKMKGSYVEKLSESHDKYGDVRPSFNQVGTDTARLSCKAGKIKDGYSGINFQGIPRDSDSDKPELFKQIRSIIIPRPGKFLVKIDYAGEELRVVTNMSGDKIWTHSFLKEDGDVHSITARSLFQKKVVSKHERGKGKASNFALIYGGGAGAIQRNIGCSMEDAQRSLANMRRDLPELMGYVEHQKQFARKHKCVYTAFGRRMPIPTIDSPIMAIRKKAERCAINYTIQATSADILKLAFCYVDKMLRQHGWSEVCKYVLTVHDEIVFEIEPEYVMEIVPKLDEWMTMPWKLKKAHGRNWVVPLETEPEVDINWKARYDFFAMTRGNEPKPKDLDADGKFIGELKGNEYFHNGRVYLKIPEFLEKYIHRLDSSLPEPQKHAQLESPEKPIEVETVKSLPDKSVLQQIEESRKPDPIPESIEVQQEKKEPVKVQPIIDIDIKPGVAPIKIKAEVVMEEGNTGNNISDDDDDDDGGFELGDDVVADDPDEEPSKPPSSAPSKPPSSAPSKPAVSSQAKFEAPKLDKSIPILRWTFRASYSQHNVKKMQAVLTLSEGTTPLRVVDTREKVIISEEEGVTVDRQKFLFLAEMFGLG